MSVLTDWIARRCGSLADAYEHYNAHLEAAGVREIRAALTADLSGPVIEVGCGTGLNFEHYPGGLRVAAVEPLDDFRRFAARRAHAVSAEISVIAGDAQRLPFADHTFHAAVATLVFCSVPDASRGLRELRRVLRPGGSVRLLEHVRSDAGWAAIVQDLANPLWRYLMDGCNLNRDTVAAVASAGWAIDAVRTPTLQLSDAGLLPMRVIHARA